MRYLLSLLVCCAMVSVVAAQEPKSCDTQLTEAQIAIELLERTSKAERTQAAADLARWIQRAQQAEKRAAQAPPPPAPAPEAPKAEGQK